MIEDFFTRALLAAMGVAVMSGPLGCFILWQRMAYFGETLAHSALLGLAFSFMVSLPLLLSVFGLAVGISLVMVWLESRKNWSSDAILGILSHASLALGLVILSFMPMVSFDMLGLLFGDILAVTNEDLVIVFCGLMLILGFMLWLWRPLLAASVSWEIAEAEGQRPQRSRLLFMVLLALVIAIAMKIIGILLITALLIIPAATARRFATSPESMAVWASVIGVAASVGGLYGSLQFDTPSGPSIVVAALVFFCVSLVPWRQRRPVRGQPDQGGEPLP